MAHHIPFKRNITEDLLQKAVKCAMTLHKNVDAATDTAGKKSVFSDAATYYTKGRLCLEINSFKIPEAVPKRKDRPAHPKINRFSVPHSLTDASTSVLLVTRDYPKLGANTTVSNAHYTSMLIAAGCNHLVTEVMSLSQLKAEYSEAESRLDLCARIDYVLCDNSVALVVPRILGKPFLVAKKFPVSVKLNRANLKQEIVKKLSLTTHKMTFKNTQSSLTFGRCTQTTEELIDNLRVSLLYLCTNYPGGWPNIKTLYITLGLKTRVPLYISTGLGRDVPRLTVDRPGPPDEVIEGDFGFGLVKLSATGTLLDYKPTEDDEDAVHFGIVNKFLKRTNADNVDDEPPKKKKSKASENGEVTDAVQNRRKRSEEEAAASVGKPPKTRLVQRFKKDKIHRTMVEDIFV